MASYQRHDELLREVAQFLKTFRALNEALATAGSPVITQRRRANSTVSYGAPEMDRSGGSSGGENRPGSPPFRVSHSPPSPKPTPSSPKPLSHTLSIDSNNALIHSPAAGGLGAVSRGNTRPVSLFSEDSDTDDDTDTNHWLPLVQAHQHKQYIVPGPPRSVQENEALRTASVQSLLSRQSFSGEQLLQHIRELSESRSGTLIALLDDVYRRSGELDASKLLATRENELYGNATYEIYDVDKHSNAVPQHDTEDKDSFAIPQQDSAGGAQDGTLTLETIWKTIKNVPSAKPGFEVDAVGRITVLQEPSPIMLSMVHHTLAKHFDMDELIQHLVTSKENKGRTRAYMNRAFEPSAERKRSFFFAFKYYTVVGEGLTPAPYQQFDQRPQQHKSPDHIDITECSSILALSLGTEAAAQVQARKGKKRIIQVGDVYDHFAPWHLLSIQSFADDHHSMRSDESQRPLHSGPYAFLDALVAEYKDAVKRYTLLNDAITKLITPSSQFMFEVKLRDKLLFEDKYFTYSRRYFWAYNSLALINEGIKSMIAAYNETFTSDFWQGNHKTLWPLLGKSSLDPVELKNYLDKLAVLNEELKRAVQDLSDISHKNEGLRKEIKSLREQLYNGSSVKESRRAIEQGDNIKILTSVSMIFLPLTFVTSVFGITEFQFSAEDWRFATTMVCVCVPFFILILILQTEAGMEMCKKAGSHLKSYFQGMDEQTKYRRELQSLATGTQDGAGQSAVGIADVDLESGVIARRQRRLFARRKKAELGSSPASTAAKDAEGDVNSRHAGTRGGWVRAWRKLLPEGKPRVRAADENV